MLLLMHFSKDIQTKMLMDTGSGDKRRLIDITSIVEEHGADMCSALLGLHTFTGCDSNSSFMKKGKIRPIKAMKRDNKYVQAFQKLGTNDNVTDNDIKTLELFVCKLYGSKKKTPILIL